MQAMEIRPPAKGSARWYIEEHDCWVGTAPTDAIPGHVVATVGDDVAPTYGGPRLVGSALEQLFGGADQGLTVHAFCE